MSANDEGCIKCGGEMVRGFLPDFTYGSIMLLSWSPKAPRARWFRGIKPGEYSVPVGAFRCADCGYLELYAREEFAAEKRSTSKTS